MNTEYYKLETDHLIDYRWRVKRHREELEAQLEHGLYVKIGMDEDQRYNAKRDLMVSLSAIRGHERSVVREMKKRVKQAQLRLPGF